MTLKSKFVSGRRLLSLCKYFSCYGFPANWGFFPCCMFFFYDSEFCFLFLFLAGSNVPQPHAVVCVISTFKILYHHVMIEYIIILYHFNTCMRTTQTNSWLFEWRITKHKDRLQEVCFVLKPN